VGVDLHMAVSSEGAVVAEIELTDEDPAVLIPAARERGAELLWVHANADLSPFGFKRASGYTRLHAELSPEGAHFSRLADADYAGTLESAYHGLWGHRQVAANATPPADAVVLGLYEGGAPVGLCTVFPEERLVDGPGIVPRARVPENYVRLLLGACAALGRGHVDIDSWGDDVDVISAYVGLGFAIVEQTDGWELRLV
jgi:hypothetical protein